MSPSRTGIRSSRTWSTRAASTLMAAVVVAYATPALGRTCSSGTPARPVPPELWGSLQPVDTGKTIPKDRDSTNFDGNQLPNASIPLYWSVDVAGGYLFAAYSSGLEIWDLEATNDGTPDYRSRLDGWNGQLLAWQPAFSEVREFFFDVDATEDGNLAVFGGEHYVSLVVADTKNKSLPSVVYQDTESRIGHQVYVGSVGGRDWAFSVAHSGDPGLHAYDLGRITPTPCLDTKTGGALGSASSSCGVYRGRIGGKEAKMYVDGLAVGSNHFLAVAAGAAGRGLEIWDVSNVAQSQAKLVVSGLADVKVYGVALWSQGSSRYLAVRTSNEGRIYDVSTCLSGGCSSLPAPLWTQRLPGGGAQYWVTFSRSGNTPYLYWGLGDLCIDGLQAEFLYDVSNPRNPIEVSPKERIPVLDDKGNTVEIDYWGWYYALNPTGFSQLQPAVAKFHGDYLYRAARTVLDAHKLTGGSPPAAAIGVLSEIYEDTAAQFTDLSTGTVETRDWTFAGGSPASSSAASPLVSFADPGSKTVTLTVGNAKGSDSASVQVQVLEAEPAIGGVGASPAQPTVCQPVTFTATGVTGKPPLGYAWTVRDGSSATVASGTANPFVWNTAGKEAGSYTAEVTVSGVAPSATASKSITLAPLADLPAAGSFAPVNELFSAGTVQFHAAAPPAVIPGATEWRWDFDDDADPNTKSYGAWSNDPVNGPNPSHTYTSKGVRAVRVQVRNCLSLDPVESAPLAVTIDELTPLVAGFMAGDNISCSGVGCSTLAGTSIEFTNLATGTDATSTWAYDWNHTGTTVATCSFGSASATPAATHTYSSTGTFRPCVRVTRGSGSESEVALHGPLGQPLAIIVEASGPPPPPPPPPSVSVFGPSSGQVGVAYTFSASAANCSPSANGWSWSTAGGTGTSTSSSITVTWSSTGGKSVRATNSACGSASGTRSITIGNGGEPPPPPPPPPPLLTAAFEFSPAQPRAGDTVRFDAGTSTGSPEIYFWDFGDGGKSEQAVAEHVFSAPGTYDVVLEVGKPDPSCNFGLCSAFITKTVTVIDGTPEPPDPCSGADPDQLCLAEGRFLVEVDWTDQYNGGQGSGKALPQSAQSGFFAFFDDENTELGLKILDGRTVNGNWWVFFGALSNVGYQVRVTDTATNPPRVRTYTNPAGELCGQSDTAAFPAIEGEPAASTSAPFFVTAEATAKPPTGPLLLLHDRFEVNVDWRDHINGGSGIALAHAGSAKTGYFSFFDQNNIELAVKMIDARPLDGTWWVFWGAMSTVEYDVVLRDRVTGEVWTHRNEPDTLCGGFARLTLDE